jgi:hypothetical protein
MAKCYRCEGLAYYHIENGYGLCKYDHNVAYYWAGRAVKNKQECECEGEVK